MLLLSCLSTRPDRAHPWPRHPGPQLRLPLLVLVLLKHVADAEFGVENQEVCAQEDVNMKG